MYNYLTILDDFHVTLSVLKFSSTCCIVFNRKTGIININDAAAALLKIESVDDHKIKKLKFELDPPFISIIHNLLIGKTVSIENFKIKCEDDRYVIVNLNVSFFRKFKDVFILQFEKRIPQDLIENSKMLSDSIQCDILMISLRMKELANAL